MYTCALRADAGACVRVCVYVYLCDVCVHYACACDVRVVCVVHVMCIDLFTTFVLSNVSDMLEDTMNYFKSKDSVVYMTLLSSRKTMSDVCKHYDITEKLFYEVFAIAQYCSDQQTYTVNFDNDHLIDTLAVMSGNTTFHPQSLVNKGFIQRVSGRYIINVLCYQAMQYYVDKLKGNFTTTSKLLNRDKTRFSSILLLDQVLYRYGKAQ